MEHGTLHAGFDRTDITPKNGGIPNERNRRGDHRSPRRFFCGYDSHGMEGIPVSSGSAVRSIHWISGSRRNHVICRLA